MKQYKYKATEKHVVFDLGHQALQARDFCEVVTSNISVVLVGIG
jgi:hypothetical protein